MSHTHKNVKVKLAFLTLTAGQETQKTFYSSDTYRGCVFIQSSLCTGWKFALKQNGCIAGVWLASDPSLAVYTRAIFNYSAGNSCSWQEISAACPPAESVCVCVWQPLLLLCECILLKRDCVWELRSGKHLYCTALVPLKCTNCTQLETALKS